jgi:hypothetical protein
MFVEHFARRLIQAYHLEEDLELSAEPSREKLMTAVSSLFKAEGEIRVFPGALEHVCADCTRPKRYKEDLIEGGVNLHQSPYAVVEGEVPGADVSPLTCWELVNLKKSDNVS